MVDGAERDETLELRVFVRFASLPRDHGMIESKSLIVDPLELRPRVLVEIGGEVPIGVEKLLCEHAHGHGVATRRRQRVPAIGQVLHEGSERGVCLA